MAEFQPPPTYLLPIKVDPKTGEATFDETWLNWFIEFSKNVGPSGAGSVSSVQVAVPVEFSVAGGPIITSGTITISKANEAANTAWMGPTSGGAAQPAFRILVTADLPAGTGTVTSVAVSGGTTGLTTSGGPITTNGTITFSGTLIAANGGTGFASYAVGDLLYASTTTALSKLADVATGNALISGGVNTAPTWGKIDLTTHVSGILPGANGGTGVANTGLTITLGGNLTTTPANAITFTTTGATNVTLPTSGTLSTTTGTVTSVAQSFTGGLISVAGSPVTTSGTLALTVAGTSGGIPYFSGATTWATSAALAASAIVLGGGAGNPPATTTTGTGVVTALGVNVGSAGAFVTFNGALGTPASGTLTNATGLPISGLLPDTLSFAASYG